MPSPSQELRRELRWLRFGQLPPALLPADWADWAVATGTIGARRLLIEPRWRFA